MDFRNVRRRRKPDVFLEITPLIDVVFLLLIFFMVSTTFVNVDTGINIILPESNVETVFEDREIVISINAKQQIYINREKVKLENFHKVLAAKLKKTGKENVIIKGDRTLPYELVVDIMTLSKNAGAKELDIATDLNK